MSATATPTLDCQTCGDPVRTLSPVEAAQVAADSYRFVAYCGSCRRDAQRAVASGGMLP